jgi:hypothetical protein
VFNVWGGLDENDFIRCANDALGAMFPEDPPLFAARIPHGYHDAATIRGDLAAGGFATRASFEALDACSRAESARIPAVGFCQGTPLRNWIEAQGASRLEEATEAVATAIEQYFGPAEVEGKIRGYVITVAKT